MNALPWILLASFAGETASPEGLFEDALYREVAAADPIGARQGYEAVLRTPGAPSRVLAKARLRLGICLELGGDTQGAAEQFRAVLERHSSEADLVRAARRRLGEDDRDDPATFMPTRVVLYVEMVNPRENVGGLSALVEGTPFQNPVDYYLSYLARRPAEDALEAPAKLDPRTPVVPQLAAFLNEYFLRELRKVEGLAFAVPAGGDPSRDFLAVLLPGSSDSLRGLVHLWVTLSSATHVGNAYGAAVFRLPSAHGQRAQPGDAPIDPPSEPPYIAIGRDVIIVGSPRSVVEDALGRGAAGRGSLADEPEFARNKGARSGGIFFAFISTHEALDAVRRDVKEVEAPAFDAVRRGFGFDRVPAVALTISHSAAPDAVVLEARGHIDEGDFAAWNALSTPALDRRILEAVPEGSLAFAAASLDRGLERREHLLRAFQPLVEALEAKGDAKALEAVHWLRDLLEGEPGGALLEAAQGIAIGVGPGRDEEPVPPVFACLRFRDPDGGGALLEAALGDFFYRALKSPAARRFEDARFTAWGSEIAAREVEPMPGVRVTCARLGDVHVAGLTRGAVGAAALACAQARASAPGADRVPPGVSKLLVVRPRDILAEGPRRPASSAEAALLLGRIERLVIATREGKDGFSVEASVPEFTATIRATLRDIGEALSSRRSDKKVEGK